MVSSRIHRATSRLARFLGLVMAAAVAAACQLAPERPSPEDLDARWAERERALLAVEDWLMSARVAVTQAERAWNASLRWQQRGEHYDLRLSGPMGQGGAHLTGDADWVTMETSRGETYAARDPGELVTGELGVDVPVAELRYWVLGVPHPDREATWDLDGEGRLERLEQEGWVVEYDRYHRVGDYDLPGRIFAKRGDVQVRLVIGNWDGVAA